MADHQQQFDQPVEQAERADPTAMESAATLDYFGPRPHPEGTPVSIRMIMILALPIIIERLFEAAIGLTDTMVAGHTPGDAATVAAASAAVGTMTYLQWFIGLMTSALGVGATAIVSRSIGARRYRVANRVAGTAMAGAFTVGLALAILMFIFAPQVVFICGLKGQAATFGLQYLRIMLLTICFQTMAQIGMASMRGAGDTLRPMLITGMVTVINVITVPSFALGWFGLPPWGIQGNALGTMVAYALSGAITLFILLKGNGKLRLALRHFRLVPHVLLRILRIGLPSWLEGMLLWFGQFFIVILVINRNDAALHMDGATMAAHNAVLRIESLAFLPGFGFGIAASALVGQYLGAKHPKQARHAALLTMFLALITMSLAALPMVIAPHWMLHWLVKSPPVVITGYWPMIIAGLAQPGFAIAIVMSSALKGAGETVTPMLATISGMFLVRVPALLASYYLLAQLGFPNLGLVAVWIGIFLDLNFRGLLNLLTFLRGTWQTKRV